ncbi:MAG TPA: TadE/TadG family type IV pilus assembly protein [Gaiellaceae bacterium]
MSKSRVRGRNESGQALVEFALLLPALLFIVFAIAQFGGLFNHYVTITDATRAGARMAAVSRLSADPVTAAVQAVRDSASDLDQAQLQVSVTPPPPWTIGEQVTVTATYPYSVDLVGIVVRSGTLSSSTKERVE